MYTSNMQMEEVISSFRNIINMYTYITHTHTHMNITTMKKEARRREQRLRGFGGKKRKEIIYYSLKKLNK